MSGTKEGGKATRATVLSKYGADYYARIGSLGGQKSTTGGFWHRKYVRGDIDFIKEAGRKGGTISRRKKAPPTAKRKWWTK